MDIADFTVTPKSHVDSAFERWKWKSGAINGAIRDDVPW